jgi:hypothetical protein
MERAIASTSAAAAAVARADAAAGRLRSAPRGRKNLSTTQVSLDTRFARGQRSFKTGSEVRLPRSEWTTQEREEHTMAAKKKASKKKATKKATKKKATKKRATTRRGATTKTARSTKRK